MEFGPEIKVSGRPDWLKSNEMVCPAWGTPAYWYPGGRVEGRKFTAAHNVADWPNVTAISLPADHPHYAQALAEHALEAQYKGEPLPNAETIAAMQEPRGQSFGTVAELMDDLNDVVRIPVMNEREAWDWCARFAYSDASSNAIMSAFRLLHIIKPDDLDRFEQHHGGLDNNQRDIAEAAIKWARGNS